MTPSTQIDITSLLKEANASEQKESYRMVEKTKNYRIGVGVRLSPISPSFFLEIILYHLPAYKNHPLSDPLQQVPFLKRLQERRYTISCQEETCTALERILPQDSLSSELTYLKTLLKYERKK
jgi:hypothetical protein